MKKLKGYIFSRDFMVERVPQHVQNLVIRDYCFKRNFEYLLSATEYAMDRCHLIFDQLMDEIQFVDGIALYSLFQLPTDSKKREIIYNQTINQSKALHFCVEGLQLHDEKSRDRIEDIWKVKSVLPSCYLFNS